MGGVTRYTEEGISHSSQISKRDDRIQGNVAFKIRLREQNLQVVTLTNMKTCRDKSKMPRARVIVLE